MPSRPPLALISSIASDSPRTMASPDFADWPDIAATRPSLTVSSALAGSGAASESDASTGGDQRPAGELGQCERHGRPLQMIELPKSKQAPCQIVCNWQRR